MKLVWAAVATSITVLVTAQPAQACRIYHGFDPMFVKHAEVVLVGTILDYEVVPGRNISGDPIQLYGRFRLKVDKVLRGKKPKVETVTWYNSTFTLPDTMPPGPYVIALWKDGFAPGRWNSPSSSRLATHPSSSMSVARRRRPSEGSRPVRAFSKDRQPSNHSPHAMEAARRFVVSR